MTTAPTPPRPPGETPTGTAAATPGEEGSASVLALGLIGVLVVLLTAAAALASAVTAGHRAAAAADLSALAGATNYAITGDAGTACARADALARANAARLISCTVVGEDVAVTTTSTPSWPGLPEARARAQAGPAPEPSGGNQPLPEGDGGGPVRA